MEIQVHVHGQGFWDSGTVRWLIRKRLGKVNEERGAAVNRAGSSGVRATVLCAVVLTTAGSLRRIGNSFL